VARIPILAGASGPRRIGILGGTFNPPHLAHLALARQALEQLGLERVALMPASASPHKPAGPDPGPSHRLAMCRLAITDAPGVSVCAAEIERGGVSYTVDTLRALKARDPDADLTLILGADTACTLAGWREPAALLELADLVVAERTGESRGGAGPGDAGPGGSERERCGRRQVREALAGLHPAPRARFVAMSPMPISSSQVRALAARGEPIEDLVGPLLAAYIAEHALYREPGVGFAARAGDSAP
jgi:nicotinate-nucleotide adenylyltransferase